MKTKARWNDGTGWREAPVRIGGHNPDSLTIDRINEASEILEERIRGEHVESVPDFHATLGDVDVTIDSGAMRKILKRMVERGEV